jgi:hypothetical protein
MTLTLNDWFFNTTWKFWAFNLPLGIWQFILAALNAVFLVAILQDFSRRSFVSEKLTEMLEVDINRKSTVALKLGSLNFVDPSSLLTWMEMRRMVFDIGKRFFIRLEGDIVAFSICILIEMGFILLKLNDFLDLEPTFSIYHYLLFGWHLLTIGIYNSKTLIIAANINEETSN